jgi:2-polyprenyl-3-methyl-5-hydroxy-6-metoxy-1,4-benzoquinol methylase
MKRKIRRFFRLGIFRALFIPYHLVKVVYWWMVSSIIRLWGKKGLHSVTVGEYKSGTEKTRSLYRESLLLRSIPLFYDLRDKTCLDLACTDGYWSLRLGRAGLSKVTGVDWDLISISRANFLKTTYALPGFQYKEGDIFEFVYRNTDATYDLVLLLSIIYHLPEQTDWEKFFGAISRINNECLVIDTRWFDDDEYWYDKTSSQAFLKIQGESVKKWRPKRREVFDILQKCGYELIFDFNPTPFLDDAQKAFGNGDPYTTENVSDYITGNRSLLFAYKTKSQAPDIGQRLNMDNVQIITSHEETS